MLTPNKNTNSVLNVVIVGMRILLIKNSFKHNYHFHFLVPMSSY
jgi:hypothetical protein